MSGEAYLIIGISAVTTALVTVFYQNGKLQKKYAEQQSENLLKMTDAMLKNTSALQSHNEINREMKQLLQTVNHNILEIKFKNGKK